MAIFSEKLLFGVATRFSENHFFCGGSYFFFFQFFFWLLLVRTLKPFQNCSFATSFFPGFVRMLCFSRELSESCLSVLFFCRGLGVGWVLPSVSFPGVSGCAAWCVGAPPPRARSDLVCVWKWQVHFLHDGPSGMCRAMCRHGSGSNHHRRMVDTCYSTKLFRRCDFATWFYKSTF